MARSAEPPKTKRSSRKPGRSGAPAAKPGTGSRAVGITPDDSPSAAASTTPQIEPITLLALQEKLADPAVPIETLEPYLAVIKDDKTGALKLVPNRKRVTELDDPALRTRGLGAMDLLNGAERRRRRRVFEGRLDSGAPILLAEGDSWFEYPVFLDDTIDALSSDHNVFCLSAAGDTMANMAGNGEVVEHFVGLAADRKRKVKAVILSAGGNDMVGATLAACVNSFKPGATAQSLLDLARLGQVLDKVMHGYGGIIEKLRAVRDDVPILIHGYDHAIPLNERVPDHEWNSHLIKRFIPREGWLGAPLASRGIVEPKLQAGIVKLMIDAFYLRLREIGNAKGTGPEKGVFLIDNRGVVAGRWNDELHPTKEGFADVADNFREVLRHLS